MGVVAAAIRRFDVYLVNLDPTMGSEIQKTRPCAVLSPDEMNRNVRTLIIAPMTMRGYAYPSRVDCQFQGRRGRIVLDQMRAVDRRRLVRRMGQLDEPAQNAVLAALQRMFAR